MRSIECAQRKLFSKAFEDGCDYFYQCGDDVQLLNPGWINHSIETLKSSNNMGVTGPIHKSFSAIYQKELLLTQSFVSRKHMEIFGYYFPNEIINWCVDDWISEVYQPNYCFPLKTKIGPSR